MIRTMTVNHPAPSERAASDSVPASIADSEAEMAGDMRSLVRTRIGAGEEPEAVRAWLIERYGDWVSYQPPITPATWPLWGAPLLFVGAYAPAGYTLTLAPTAIAAPGERAPYYRVFGLEVVDADRDGRVTLAELRPAAEAMFRAQDANGDGVLAREEVSPRHGRPAR